MNWYILEKYSNFDLPEWARTFGVDEDDLVYIPAAITQIPEEDVCKRLEADPNPNIPMAQYNGHFYMPSNWLSKEYPLVADLCQLFELQAKKINEI